jgi:signal transduction histidine kinase
MKRERVLAPIRSISQFKVTRGQYFIGSIALISILGLGVSSYLSSQATVGQAKVLSDIETPAASIIFTQRETLVYATRLAQWSNGGTTRRSVQIARSLLAQRLAVIDTSGRSMGSRAQPSYWKVIKDSDAIVASAPAGILPEATHAEYNAKIVPIIDEILSEARSLVVSYQRSVDDEMIQNAKEIARRDQLNLLLFYVFLLFGGIFLVLNVRSNFRNYREAGIALKAEQLRLNDTIAELKATQTHVLELEDLSTAKNAFISTVNHELRTPLTSIIGYIDVMRDEKIDQGNPNVQMYLDVLDRNAQILLQLVESMLSLSRIDAAEGELPSVAVNINEVIDNAIFLMKPNTEKSKIEINVTATEELFVTGDDGQLNQIFINLLGNAIKFSPEGSTISILIDRKRMKDGHNCVSVAVSDQGIGIPAGEIDQLFTRFFRASNAESGHFPGTGLGLSIVQQVVKRHHGLVEVSSLVGVGTTFTVNLPIFISSEEKLILDRRLDVLTRGINSLKDSTRENFKAVTHDIGGALGFYHFESLGSLILEYSRSFTPNHLSEIEFIATKARLLEKMKNELESIESSDHV